MYTMFIQDDTYKPRYKPRDKKALKTRFRQRFRRIFLNCTLIYFILSSYPNSNYFHKIRNNTRQIKTNENKRARYWLHLKINDRFDGLFAAVIGRTLFHVPHRHRQWSLSHCERLNGIHVSKWVFFSFRTLNNVSDLSAKAVVSIYYICESGLR